MFRDELSREFVESVNLIFLLMGAGCTAARSEQPSLGGMPANGPLCQDKRLLWDQRKSTLTLRGGEYVCSKWECVEDSKGRNGLGTLWITNLRMIWVSASQSKTNMSIGLNCIAYVHFNMIDSNTFGRVRAPHLMTQVGYSKFEFMFGIRDSASSPLFAAMENALVRYKATKVYREVLLKEKWLLNESTGQPAVFYGERIEREFERCDNVAATERFAGRMVVTNCRIVWINCANPDTVNVSVPFCQMKGASVRSTNFGKAVVVETQLITPLNSKAGQNYVLGFAFEDPYQPLKLVQKLFLEWKANPNFGPRDGVVHYVGDRLMLGPSTISSSHQPDLTNGLTSGGLARTTATSSPPATPPMQRLLSEYKDMPPPSSLLRNTAPDIKHSPTRSCIVCMGSGAEIAFDPCGHLSTCHHCATQLHCCPVCRTTISKRLRIFINYA